jgi:short-subunit dehydrogenase|tara:strand:+ start:15 stop:851 length:837 start_codon:yes stop_codon:yes gene_type:complete
MINKQQKKILARLQGKKALVTGASKGIGRTIAEELSSNGVQVALLARSKDKLNEIVSSITRSGNKALALASDLRDRDSILSAVAEYKKQFGSLDFLINNAGFGVRRLWKDVSLDMELEMMAVNYSAPVMLTRHFLPDMLSRDSGHIVNINSFAGMYAAPYQGAYAASKSALASYATSLAYELKKTDVHISSIYLGPTDTEFIRSAHDKDWVDSHKQGKLNTTKDVARVVISTLVDPKETKVVGSSLNLLAARLTNLNPRLARTLIEKKHTPPKDLSGS